MNDFIRPIDEPEQSYDCPSLTGGTKKESPMPNLEAEIEKFQDEELKGSVGGRHKAKDCSICQGRRKALLSLINKEIGRVVKKLILDNTERGFKREQEFRELRIKDIEELKEDLMNYMPEAWIERICDAKLSELRGGKK